MPKSRPVLHTSANGQVRQLLESGEAYATTMLVLCWDAFADLHEKGDEWMQWHPAAMRANVQEHFGVKLPEISLDRLMAGISVLTTDEFFQNLRSFVPLANVLAGSEFDPETFDPADSAECAWAVTEALLLNPPDEQDPQPVFSDEIRKYIGRVLHNEGYVTPPDVLRIAIDGDFSAQVAYDFGEDPEMFGMIHHVQTGKTEDIERVVRESLLELALQLKTLPLRHGDTSGVEALVQRAVTKATNHEQAQQTQQA